MSYVSLAVMAMLGYGLTAFLLKIAFRQITPEAAAVYTNLVLVVAALVFTWFRGESLLAPLKLGTPTIVLLAASGTLSFSIISYYMALSRGPTSAVVPIFGMSLVVAAALGILLLGEGVKVTKLAGIAMAAGALVLLTR